MPSSAQPRGDTCRATYIAYYVLYTYAILVFICVQVLVLSLILQKTDLSFSGGSTPLQDHMASQVEKVEGSPHHLPV